MRSLLPIALVVVAGCGSAVPSPIASPLPTIQATNPAQATNTLAPTAAPSRPPVPVVTPAPKPGVADLAVEFQRIESDLAHHVETFVSLGNEVVWGGGATDGTHNLYRYSPGATGPELLYANPDSEASIGMVRGSAAGYVFTQVAASGSWRLLYLPSPADDPIQLDESSDDRLPVPTIAMDDSWIAWEVVHGTVNDHLNELFAARVEDPLHPLKLLSFSGRDAYLQFPNLWGDELWFGIADNDWNTGTEKPRVEMIDLNAPGVPPTVFGAAQRAFMPAPGRDVVAWKSGGTPDLAASNAGTLTLYWRAGGATDTLPVPGPERLAERISYPSVGDRFVAWWDDVRSRLYVYDLAERQFRRVAEYDLSSDEVVARPSLSGDLLAFMHYLPSGAAYLEWTMLPH